MKTPALLPAAETGFDRTWNHSSERWGLDKLIDTPAKFETPATTLVGAPLKDIEEEAERWAAWIVDRAAREVRTDKSIGQMLAQFTQETSTASANGSTR